MQTFSAIASRLENRSVAKIVAVLTIAVTHHADSSSIWERFSMLILAQQTRGMLGQAPAAEAERAALRASDSRRKVRLLLAQLPSCPEKY